MRWLKLLLIAVLAVLPVAAIGYWWVGREFQGAWREEGPTPAMRVVDVAGARFFNLDHGPMGVGASLIYGDAGGQCGFFDAAREQRVGSEDDEQPWWRLPGVVMGVRRGDSLTLLPFAQKRALSAEKVSWLGEQDVKRTVTPSVDEITAGDLIVRHWSPTWTLAEWDEASAEQRRDFVLPASWMEVRAGGGDVVVGLAEGGEAKSSGGWTAVAYGSNFVAARDGKAVKVGPATCLSLDARGAMVVVGHLSDRRFALEKARTAAATRYADWVAVCDAAERRFGEAKERCRQVDAMSAKLSFERRWMTSLALASYRANVLLLEREGGGPVWVEVEGEFRFLNTLDLAVDHVFLHRRMFPWATRNVLDLFAERFAARDGKTIRFAHDMGKDDFLTGQQAYPASMAREELLNWVLCAAAYAQEDKSRDWLKGKREVLLACAESLREPIEEDEITTYDSLDVSIKKHPDNPYVAVKTYVAWGALAKMLDAVGEGEAARRCAEETHAAAGEAVQMLGRTKSRVLPAVEGLAFAESVGEKWLPRLAEVKQALRAYVEKNLVRGVWVDADHGALRLTPEARLTWLSKAYLCQHVLESQFGIDTNASDAAHATMVLQGAAQGWCDQYSPREGHAKGSLHYPRGVTSVLWWR